MERVKNSMTLYFIWLSFVALQRSGSMENPEDDMGCVIDTGGLESSLFFTNIFLFLSRVLTEKKGFLLIQKIRGSRGFRDQNAGPGAGWLVAAGGSKKKMDFIICWPDKAFLSTYEINLFSIHYI